LESGKNNMKPILIKEENVELYLENFNQLGSALMKSGGEPFRILKKYDDFLRTLAANNIEVTAKYKYPEEAMPLKTTDGPNFRLTEEDWNSFGEYHLKPDVNEWKEWKEKRAKADEELQKLVKEDPMWQKPLCTTSSFVDTLTEK
jgi:hypothetical protein